MEEPRLAQLLQRSEATQLLVTSSPERLCLSGKVANQCASGGGSRVFHIKDAEGAVLAKLALVGSFTFKDPFPEGDNSSERVSFKAPTAFQDTWRAPLTKNSCVCEALPADSGGILDCGAESGWCCSAGERRQPDDHGHAAWRALLLGSHLREGWGERRRLLSEDVSQWRKPGVGSLSKKAPDSEARRNSFRQILHAATVDTEVMGGQSAAPVRSATVVEEAAGPRTVVEEAAGSRTCRTVGPCIGRSWDYCTPAQGENRAVLALL